MPSTPQNALNASELDADDLAQPVTSHQKYFEAKRLSDLAQRRFFTTDFPVSMAAGAATYFLFRRQDSQTQMLKAFQKLVKNRAEALEILKFLKKHAVSSRAGQYLISPQSMGLVAPINLAAQIAESPTTLRPMQQRFLMLNPNNVYAMRLNRALSNYGQAYQYIVGHPKKLQTMMLPMVTRLLEMSPFQARVLATSRPQQLLTRLFSRSLNNKQLTPAFFNRVFQELSSAANRMAGLMAFSVLMTLLGVAVTRMETQMHEVPAR